MIAGRYRLEREIGRGGSGTVHLAVDEVLGRQVAIKRIGRELVTGSRAGVHGSLTVGSDQDQAAPGGRAIFQWRRFEPDPEGVHVMLENEAKLIFRDLTDEGGTAAHRGDAGHGIGRRSAGHLAGDTHRRVKFVRLCRRKQLHRAFRQPVRDQEFVIATGDDVDDRISHGNDIERRIGHERVAGSPCGIGKSAPA